MTWRRCHVTKNECGTDTWKEGHTCPCLQCQAYLAEKRLEHPSTARRVWGEAFGLYNDASERHGNADG